MKRHRDTLLYSTFILTLANFIIRIMGFVYKIILSRVAGAEAMGLIQLMLPLYFTFISIVASGVPIALSRTIAKHRSKEDSQAIRDTLTSSFIGILVLSCILFFIFIVNIGFFAEKLLKYDNTRIPLILLSPCIVIIGIKSIFKGFFYGIKSVHIPAVSDIFEQIVRIGLVLFLFYYISPNNIETAACIIVVGMVIGELISLLFLHIKFYYIAKESQTSRTPTCRYIPTIKSIGNIAFPITITRVVLSLVSSASAVIVPRQLVMRGMTPAQALNAFGIIGSMVMPLFFIPFTIINGLSTILVPNISEDMTAKRLDRARDKISKAIVITNATALFCSGILAVLGRDIGLVLFKEPEVGKYIVPSAPFLILLCLHQTLNSAMNGLSLEKDSTANNIIGGIVELISLYIFIPNYGVYGYIISFYMGSAAVIVLHYICINREINLGLNIVKWLLKPAFSALLMASCIRLFTLQLVNIGTSPYTLILLSSSIGLFIFVIVFSLLSTPSHIFQKKST